MPEETPFRVAIVVILLITMPVAIYFRLRAAASGERISHQAEGYVFALILRLAGLGVWISLFTYLFNPAAMRWATLPLPGWVRWVGVVAGCLSPLMMYWTLSSLGKNLTDTVVTRANANLVTHGPYRWVRHPFYVTAALLLGCVAVISASWLIFLWGVVVLAMLAVRTDKEEAMLIERFGEPYRDYMSRTGRFIPRLWPIPRPDPAGNSGSTTAQES